jgi:hypothetical protein
MRRYFNVPMRPQPPNVAIRAGAPRFIVRSPPNAVTAIAERESFSPHAIMCEAIVGRGFTPSRARPKLSKMHRCRADPKNALSATGADKPVRSSGGRQSHEFGSNDRPLRDRRRRGRIIGRCRRCATWRACCSHRTRQDGRRISQHGMRPLEVAVGSSQGGTGGAGGRAIRH